jgi:hypothetical protein
LGVYRQRNRNYSATVRRLAVALQFESGHLLGNVIHRHLFTGFNDPKGDIVQISAAGVRITGVIDEPRWRRHQDVATVDDRQKNPLLARERRDRLIAEYVPAAIDDDFAGFDRRAANTPRP